MSGRAGGAWLPGLILGLVLAGPGWAAPSGSGPATIDARERSIIAQLDELDQRLIKLRSDRRSLAGDLDLIRTEAREAGAEVDRLTRAKAELKKRLGVRLRALYTHGRASLARLELVGSSLREGVLGRHCLARMVKFDLQLIEDYNRLRLKMERIGARLAVRQAKMDRLEKRLALAETHLAAQVRDRAALLVRIDRERRVHEQALAELNRAAAELNKELAGLEQERAAADRAPVEPRAEADSGPPEPAGEPFAARRGRLAWPLKGRLVRMADRKRKGVLIRAPEGSRVRAVAGGRVVHAGWIRGYGSVVIIDHGERYYTLSAHLEEILTALGRTVAPGQEIGYSGRAGLARPGMYFEIRHKNQTLNPAGWLAKRGSEE